jgi:hypothetical protein
MSLFFEGRFALFIENDIFFFLPEKRKIEWKVNLESFLCPLEEG